MNTEDMSLFVEVAQHRSFATVAKLRNIDPSSVSRAISALETTLAVRLFHRTTRSMSLTEAGEHYLARAVPVLEELERMHHDVKDADATPKGTLRITASATFGETQIVPLLPRFKLRYPSLKLECFFTDANVDLVTDRIDLAIRLAPSIEGDVVVSKLMDTHYRVVASPEYLKHHGSLNTPEDLRNHQCVLFTLKNYQSHWLFKNEKGEIKKMPVSGEVALSPAGSVKRAALCGTGPALLPHWLVDSEISSGALVHCIPDWQVSANTFDTAAWLVYPSRHFLPNKVRVLIDFLKENMSQAPT